MTPTDDVLPGAATRSAFMTWLYDQHTRDDAIGSLAAQLRGDPEEPNPTDGTELAGYLAGRGASETVRIVAADAWAVYLATVRYPDLAVAVIDYAQTWGSDPDCRLELTVDELLDDLDYESDVVTRAELTTLLVEAAPVFLAVENVAVRAEGNVVQLRHVADLDELGSRYDSLGDH